MFKQTSHRFDLLCVPVDECEGMGFKRPSHCVSIPVTNPLLLQEPSRQCKGVERCVVCVLGWDILGYGGGRGGWRELRGGWCGRRWVVGGGRWVVGGGWWVVRGG